MNGLTRAAAESRQSSRIAQNVLSCPCARHRAGVGALTGLLATRTREEILQYHLSWLTVLGLNRLDAMTCKFSIRE
jgi:hypothetical protein